MIDEENTPVGVPLGKPLKEAAIQEFAASFRGELIRPVVGTIPPSSGGYSRLRVSDRKEILMQRCTHLDQINDVTPSAEGCEECLQMGDTWVHLRECLTCGHVGCCDSSKNKHATKHFHAANHPIIQSFEPGEDWLWCYVDEIVMVPRS